MLKSGEFIFVSSADTCSTVSETSHSAFAAELRRIVSDFLKPSGVASFGYTENSLLIYIPAFLGRARKSAEPRAVSITVCAMVIGLPEVTDPARLKISGTAI